MRKCKTKVIQADLGIFIYIQTYPNIIRPIQAYSGIIQAYFEPFVTLAYFIFRILTYSKLEAYSEP